MALPRIITFGEVMARVATPGAQRFMQALPGTVEVTFAGAEANVAAGIAQLGGDASFVTALPQHEVADAVVAHLRAAGVDTKNILRTPVGRMGLFFLEQGRDQRPARVIYDREGSSVSILPASAYNWAAIFAEADWFHVSGVTPALSANAADVALHAMREAAARGLQVSFDMNFRSRLWQWEPGTPPRTLATRIVRELLPHVHLFIGGPDDIALLTGESLPAADTRSMAARAMTRHWPGISRVAMTIRETLSASHHRLGGILCDAAADRICLAPVLQGQPGLYDMPNMADRLGGGDAFAAGLIYALTTPELSAPEKAVAFATAASCLAHSIPGDFALIRRAEAEALMQGAAGGTVNR